MANHGQHASQQRLFGRRCFLEIQNSYNTAHLVNPGFAELKKEKGKEQQHPGPNQEIPINDWQSNVCQDQLQLASLFVILNISINTGLAWR